MLVLWLISGFFFYYYKKINLALSTKTDSSWGRYRGSGLRLYLGDI